MFTRGVKIKLHHGVIHFQSEPPFDPASGTSRLLGGGQRLCVLQTRGQSQNSSAGAVTEASTGWQQQEEGVASSGFDPGHRRAA